ncbi:response regulator [Roseovarius aestuariivivens]|uniref:response regulator n=1 Tax=Roseovarius aestuariivivens TaxID=1888910 RepID=UPI001436B519|nr:response regulator [Roseovarius aestuariivivens]
MQAVRRYKADGMRCLVVEDSRHDQEMIRRALRGARVNAEMTCVGTLADARKVLKNETFDMILVDNSLPDGRGSDFARDLAGRDGFRRTPIVIVSGWPSPFMWDKARESGLAVIDKTDEPILRLRDMFRRSLRSTGGQAAVGC